jgi:gp32 DNA binding protein like
MLDIHSSYRQHFKGKHYMADPKLDALRAALRADAEKKNGNKSSSSGGDNASYPFWDIPEKTSATLRFLPDADDNNPWFWVERQTIKLPFQGIVGGDYPTDKQVLVTVPCVDMFGDTCPIIAETRPWWKDDAKKDTARTYYKKRSYIAQGFVVDSPFEEASVPENPIRRFLLGPSLLEKIKAGLADPDMEHHPTDTLNGCDFRIRKTKKQDYNNYDTSEWARRSRALTEAERIAIDQYKLFNLKDFLGARPDADGIAVIKAMFHASLAGEPFDNATFGKHYRAYGGGGRTSNDEATDAIETAAARATRTPAVAAEATGHGSAEAVGASHAEAVGSATGGGEEPQDLLIKLRHRAANRS